MIDESKDHGFSYFRIQVIKVTKGVRTESVWEKILESDHPKVKSNPDQSQYGAVEQVKSFEDKLTVYDQAVKEIDIERIVRAVNVGI